MSNYLDYYVNMISGAMGQYFGKSFRYLLMDSWEAGHANWTEDMAKEFRARRGYDPTPYLPVLTGRVVESADVSDRFLWDFRRTIADLLAENHYAGATEYLRLFGYVALGHMWLRSSRVALERKAAGGAFDAAWYETKVATARFYFTRMMSQCGALSAAVQAGGSPILDFPIARF